MCIRSMVPGSYYLPPLGTLCLISIPMDYTNLMQIQHGDLIFLLQDEISDVVVLFVNNVLVKGPPI